MGSNIVASFNKCLIFERLSIILKNIFGNMVKFLSSDSKNKLKWEYQEIIYVLEKSNSTQLIISFLENRLSLNNNLLGFLILTLNEFLKRLFLIRASFAEFNTCLIKIKKKIIHNLNKIKIYLPKLQIEKIYKNCVNDFFLHYSKADSLQQTLSLLSELIQNIKLKRAKLFINGMNFFDLSESFFFPGLLIKKKANNQSQAMKLASIINPYILVLDNITSMSSLIKLEDSFSGKFVGLNSCNFEVQVVSRILSDYYYRNVDLIISNEDLGEFVLFFCLNHNIKSISKISKRELRVLNSQIEPIKNDNYASKNIIDFGYVQLFNEIRVNEDIFYFFIGNEATSYCFTLVINEYQYDKVMVEKILFNVILSTIRHLKQCNYVVPGYNYCELSNSYFIKHLSMNENCVISFMMYVFAKSMEMFYYHRFRHNSYNPVLVIDTIQYLMGHFGTRYIFDWKLGIFLPVCFETMMEPYLLKIKFYKNAFSFIQIVLNIMIT
mmetsp:Transcript_13054/g.31983  ORF Transcript_13054/g.31983 Transcript_13054/m.31983 type:complete len:494 (-) Transcript_13054:613-2094(-)